jgi:putative restriction endonuclease
MRYDLEVGEGVRVWRELQLRMAASQIPDRQDAIAQPRFGPGYFVRPRLGQGTFRIVVMDTYERRCAVTGERTLPVLEAAHIRPYSEGGDHRVDNGLLLRTDLHTLFDRGYVTVTPEHRLEVSRRIREEFENGRDYYALHGHAVRVPADPLRRPRREWLEWHNREKYLA